MKRNRGQQAREDKLWALYVRVFVVFSSLFTDHSGLFFSSFSLCLIRSLLVKCLLRQVVTWSILLGPILSSLSKPYNWTCSHTFIDRRGLLLFQQQHTRVQIKQYLCMLIENWPLDSHLYTKYMYIHGVCLSVCSYRIRKPFYRQRWWKQRTGGGKKWL